MPKESETRDCPYCIEEIKADAIKCRHCGSSVAPESPSHEGTCPYCKEEIHPQAIKCKNCGSDLHSRLPSEFGWSQFETLRGLNVMPDPFGGPARTCLWTCKKTCY